ncbi:LOW QUALITY PROTEIN: hypothetical protein T265_13870 [Opisthorchis viverrini]|uniref:Uncharacterized protein n=1 Tax=Opisthorchis viverrini TaxID=6198 RepID=A0A074ZII1_OPIVI|nr:LOW QUALITY PROTEIN: hypothetical protein T265_13870 [Opisthorchis viverrini]KER27118.1 LOW QUALITY PROTEIN: hypothetical protein T265_13870 [Opisthorchis viverrini]
MLALKRLVKSPTYPIYKRLQDSESYLTNAPGNHADCDAGFPLEQASVNKKRFFNLGKVALSASPPDNVVFVGGYPCIVTGVEHPEKADCIIKYISFLSPAYSLVKLHEQGLWQCAVLSSSWIEGRSPSYAAASWINEAELLSHSDLRCRVDRINFSDGSKKAHEHERKFQHTSNLETSDVTIEMGRNHPRRK